jgi:menaquinone-specific isochorismate synthase
MAPGTFEHARSELAGRLRAAAGEGPGIRRLEARVAPCDAVGWLAAQDDEVKGFWSDRDSTFEVAAVGEADVVKASGSPDHGPVLEAIRGALAGADGRVRYYGGFRFGPPHATDGSWRAFGSARFILPAVELVRHPEGCALACNVRAGPDHPKAFLEAAARVERLVPAGPATVAGPGRPVGRLDTPGRDAWTAAVRHALRLIRGGSLAKLVLARRSVFAFRDPVDAVGLLRALRARAAGAFLFCGSHARHVGFVGASPERLYRRDGRRIAAEAVAGTRPRGGTADEDGALGRGLLASAKDRAEHAFVADSVRAALDPLCEAPVAAGGLELLKLGSVQHLRTRLAGVLRAGVGDAEILRGLHPTPAVGGHPREAALKELAALEPFDRGWYAAPVGWVGADAAEFIVALRCGAAWDNRLCLFAGAGIVEGSEPDAEWDEIESKVGHFVSVFAGP